MITEQINAHYIQVNDVVNKIDTSIESGLTEKEAKNRLERFGLNELVQRKKVSAWQIFIGQFKDFLVYLLLFTIAVSVIVGFYELSKGGKPSEFLDAIAIFIILVVNAILGFYQEYKAEKSFFLLLFLFKFKKYTINKYKTKDFSILKILF